MPEPEQRFEVPPEYAEVYERAYRRAYEESQGAEERPAVGPVSGRPGPSNGVGIPPQRDGGGTGISHRAEAPSPSLRQFLFGVAALLLVVVDGVLVLGGFTIDPQSLEAGGAAGSQPSATRGASSDPAARPTTTYGEISKSARILDVRSSCTARATTNAQGETVEYQARNVVDDDPDTIWRCEGLAVGQELSFTLAPGTEVVQVGVVPGDSRRDPGAGANHYVRNNWITRVSWNFGHGVVLEQTLGHGRHGRHERSLRTMDLRPTRTARVRLKILGVSAGKQNDTTISRVRIRAAG